MCFDKILKNCILLQLIYPNPLHQLFLFIAISLQLIQNSTMNKFANFAFSLRSFVKATLLAKRIYCGPAQPY